MRFLVVFLALLSLSQAQYAAICSGRSQWQIRQGDTFWNLACQDWAITCAFLHANPGVNPCTLQPGQMVNCPSSSSSTQCTSTDLAWPCISSIGTPPVNYCGVCGSYSTYMSTYSGNSAPSSSGSNLVPVPGYNYNPSPSYNYNPAPAPAPSYNYNPSPSYNYNPSPSYTYNPAPAPAPSYNYNPSPSYTYNPAPAPSYNYNPSPSYNYNPSPSYTYAPAPAPAPAPSYNYNPSPSYNYNPSPSYTYAPAPAPAPAPSYNYNPSPSYNYNPSPSYNYNPSPSYNYNPSPSSSSGSSVCSGQYQIKPGNTFYNLANQNWAVMCAFLNANPGVNPCTLQPGQMVNCPSSSSSTQCTSTDLAWPCISAMGTPPANYCGVCGSYSSYSSGYGRKK